MQSTIAKGKIVKGIGGFYYVETAEAIFECKARGSFRKQNISPLVGDNVLISVTDNSDNRIEEILQRDNMLIRPPLANIDILFIVSSMADPAVNTYNIDKLAAIAEYKGIESVIVLTKIDLNGEYDAIQKAYESAGYHVVLCSNTQGRGVDAVSALIQGHICAFAGNSGVGKSSLLNQIAPDLHLETGVTSKRLGRGRHTTRYCELFHAAGGYIADTPGFSSLDFERCERILKNDLPDCFPEFRKYLGKCKFNSCCHINDKGCKILEAVTQGDIARSRHKSYVQMYQEVKNIKEWESR